MQLDARELTAAYFDVQRNLSPTYVLIEFLQDSWKHIFPSGQPRNILECRIPSLFSEGEEKEWKMYAVLLYTNHADCYVGQIVHSRNVYICVHKCLCMVYANDSEKYLLYFWFFLDELLYKGRKNLAKILC